MEINFKELEIQSFDELITNIESGLIVCPFPDFWKDFYDTFITWDDPKNKLLPIILTGWWGSSDEEKNERFKLQLAALKGMYIRAGINTPNQQNVVFKWFDNYKNDKILVNQSLFKSKFNDLK